MGGGLAPALFVMIRLSERLSAIAEKIPPGSRVIDVGTDHGHLPVWLIEEGRASSVIASDVNPGPLSRAASLVEEHDLAERIRLVVCDGLDAFSAGDGDCVVLAGMGGEVMTGILSRADWLRSGTFLVLQPQSKKEHLRAWLCENGFSIGHESLVKDAGRIYSVFTARAGRTEDYTAAELHLGKKERIREDPLLPEYLDELILKTQKKAPFDSSSRDLLEELNNWKERL